MVLDHGASPDVTHAWPLRSAGTTTSQSPVALGLKQLRTEQGSQANGKAGEHVRLCSRVSSYRESPPGGAWRPHILKL